MYNWIVSEIDKENEKFWDKFSSITTGLFLILITIFYTIYWIYKSNSDNFLLISLVVIGIIILLIFIYLALKLKIFNLDNKTNKSFSYLLKVMFNRNKRTESKDENLIKEVQEKIDISLKNLEERVKYNYYLNKIYSLKNISLIVIGWAIFLTIIIKCFTI